MHEQANRVNQSQPAAGESGKQALSFPAPVLVSGAIMLSGQPENRLTPSAMPGAQRVVQRAVSLDNPDVFTPYVKMAGKIGANLLLCPVYAEIATKAVIDFAGTFFQQLKVTPPKIAIDPEIVAGDGALDWSTWELIVGASTPTESVNSENSALIMGAVFHELRHAEQLVRSVRWAVAKNKSQASITHDLGIPDALFLEVKAGVTADSGNDQQACKWYDSRHKGDAAQKDVVKLGMIAAEAEKMLITSLDPISKHLRALAKDLKTKLNSTAGASKTMKDADDSIKTCTDALNPKKIYKPFEIMEGIVSAYRSLEIEKDAHLLGWKIENSILGNIRPETFVTIKKSALALCLDTALKSLLKLQKASDDALFDEMNTPRNTLLTYVDTLDQVGFDFNTEWDIGSIKSFIKTYKETILAGNRSI
jgi:hypothetical protein